MSYLPSCISKIIIDYIKDDSIEYFYINNLLHILGEKKNVPINTKYRDVNYKDCECKLNKQIENIKNVKMAERIPSVRHISLDKGLYLIDKKSSFEFTIFLVNRHRSYKFCKFYKIDNNIGTLCGRPKYSKDKVKIIGLLCIEHLETDCYFTTKTINNFYECINYTNQTTKQKKGLSNSDIYEKFLDVLIKQFEQILYYVT